MRRCLQRRFGRGGVIGDLYAGGDGSLRVARGKRNCWVGGCGTLRFSDGSGEFLQSTMC